MIAVALVSTAMSLSAHPSDADSFPFHQLDGFKFLLSGDPLTDWNPAREWTSTDGRNLKAKVVALRDEDADFLIAGGKRTKIALSLLSKEDQLFLREWAALSEYFNTSYKPAQSLSGEVKADMGGGVFAKEGKFHETKNFRFECDVPLRATLAKDFSKLFEVTHTAVAKLPLGLSLDRPDGKKILVHLFASEADYIAAGGKKDAAGIYLSKERLVLVPLASLGIVRGDNGKCRKTRDFDPATLIHETTHAVMHHWLQHMPLWLSEGLAEYVAALPYRDGVLYYSKHKAGLHALAAKKFGGKAEKFELMEPQSFVHLDHSVFMGGRPVREQVIRLPVVNPFQIKLVKPGAPAAKGNGAVAVSVAKSKTIEVIPVKPLFGNPDPTVVRRYVSSMLLIQHLLKNDPAALRKYLFSLLHGEWSRSHYLDEWNKAHRLHTDAVNAQISTFNAEFQQFIADVGTFNAAVKRHNAGEVVKVPKRPVEPVPPKALPVAKILAKPKSDNELSRNNMQKRAIERHLELPKRLRLPDKG